MFTTAYVIDMPGGEPEAATVGIGEPSEFELMDDDQQLADERVFYYFQSLDEIRLEHTGWAADTWFTVVGLDLPCYVCGDIDDEGEGNAISTVEHAPDNYGDPIELETVVKCLECRRDYV